MGKLEQKELQTLLQCIKKDPRVVIPPQVGYDAGVHFIGDKYLVVATDPCVGVPEEWFGYLLVHYAASDMALFGAIPQFCTITLMGPKHTEPLKFQRIMQQTCEATEDLNIAIVRGHTGTYDGILELTGVCTVYGTVESDSLITPRNAKPGDLILCTKPFALETAVNFSLIQRNLAQKLFGKEKTEEISKLVPEQSCVKEAIQLAKAGVHAMHDATEGGLVSALNEFSEASGLGFKLNFDMLPIFPEARRIQENFGLSEEQLLAMSSTGTIIAAVEPKSKEEALVVLSKSRLKPSFVGEFTESKRRIIVEKGKERKFPEYADDPYGRIMLRRK
jgi:hydrogenase expression/formation protein HypE